MIIYPALDLRGGQCVRLYQGDYTQEKIYQPNPLVMVKDFVSAGATWLHLIDLDGAKNPQKNQTDLIVEIVKNCGIKAQVGGGIRHSAQIKQLIEEGVERIIVGSMAVSNPLQVVEWIREWGPERILLAVDVKMDEVKQLRVVVNAWQTSSERCPFEMLAYFKAVGLKHVLCTDVSRDGTLQGPNMSLYDALFQHFPDLFFQVSGGVSSLSDLKILRDHQISGVIIGRALYEKKFTLKEAFSC